MGAKGGAYRGIPRAEVFAGQKFLRSREFSFSQSLDTVGLVCAVSYCLVARLGTAKALTQAAYRNCGEEPEKDGKDYRRDAESAEKTRDAEILTSGQAGAQQAAPLP